MRTLVIALAFVASAYAFNVEDIPAHMKDRLDRAIALKKEWQAKWLSMTVEEQNQYEQVLLARIDQLPQIEIQRIHDRIAALPQEHRLKLRDYLRRRFPVEDSEAEYENEIVEMDDIVQSLPEMIRNKISSIIHAQFQEASAYNIDTVSSLFFLLKLTV